MRDNLAQAMYEAAIEKVATDENHPSHGESFTPWDSLNEQAKIPFFAAADKFLRQDFRLDAEIEEEGE